MLAHHYSEAVAPDIAELAWRDREDELRQLSSAALRWLRRAAELSLARFDLDDALSQLHRAAELAPGDAGVWHAIGRVNALKFDGEAMWPAMEKAIELTEGTEALAELYAELTFESTMRGGMWKRPLDHALVESWLARALELADAGGARARQSPRHQVDVGGRRRAGGAGGRARRAARRSGASVLRLLGPVGSGVRRSRLPRGRPAGRNAASSSSTA